MGKFMQDLEKHFAERRREEAAFKTRRKQHFAHGPETETYATLKSIYHRVSELTDKDPFWQVMHHLAGLVNLNGPHESEGMASFQALIETKESIAAYRTFLDLFRKETSDRIFADRPLIDPIGDLYMEVKGFDRFLTPMDTVHVMNTMTVGAHEKDISPDRFYDLDGIQVPKNPLAHKDTFLTGMDPACGTGRFGFDAIGFYPRMTTWNIDSDLNICRLATLNTRLLVPWTNIHSYMGERPAMMVMGRCNNMWADSLLIDVGHKYNWNFSTNRWDPPDWRLELLTVAGTTLYEYEKQVGENHAIDELHERNAKMFNLEGDNAQRFQITQRPPMAVADMDDVEIDEDFEEEIDPGSQESPPRRAHLPGLPSVADSLGQMLDVHGSTDALVGRFLEEQERENRALIEGADPVLRRLKEWGDRR